MSNRHELSIDGRVRLRGDLLERNEIYRGSTTPGLPEITTQYDWRGKVLSSPYELWIFAGSSNDVGFDPSAEVDISGVDSPHPRVLEVSRERDTATYRAAPNLDLHLLYPNPQDAQGVTALGPAQQFGKARVSRHAAIKELAVLAESVLDSGFRVASTIPSWLPGGLIEGTLNRAQEFLRRHPRYRFMGVVTGLGINDVRNSTQAQRVADLTQFAERFRSEIPGGESSVLVISQQPRALIDTSVHNGVQDAAHQEVANTLERAILSDHRDLPTPDGAPMFFAGDTIRLLGSRLAQAADEVLDLHADETVPSYRMGFDRGTGEFRDANGSPARILDGVYETDPERGRVLRLDGTRAYDTTMRFDSRGEYTKALWLKRFSIDPSGNFDQFIGGQVTNGTSLEAFGHAFGEAFLYHLPRSVVPTIRAPFADADTRALDEWNHFAATYRNGQFQSYFNGLPLGPAFAYPQGTTTDIVQIGTAGSLNGVPVTPAIGTRTIPDARMDDIFVAPIGLDDAGIQRLYASGAV